MAGRQRIRNPDRWREKMIRVVAGILDEGEPSKFAFEAHCRHSIRSHLCLEGALWIDADQRAASIVTAALDRIKAVRPTWWETQIDIADEYIARRHCIKCGGSIEGEAVGSKYCGDRCRKLFEIERPCDQCGKVYVVDRSNAARQKHCSRECTTLSQTIYFEQPCEFCGTMFKPESWGHGRVTRFCSLSCRSKARGEKRPDVICPICCTVFRPKRPESVVCSRVCAGVVSARKRAAAKSAPPAAEEEPMRRAAE